MNLVKAIVIVWISEEAVMSVSQVIANGQNNSRRKGRGR